MSLRPFSTSDRNELDSPVATATRLVRPGPEVSRDEARSVVAELRRHAKASEGHVRGFTRMGTEETHDTPVLVVDRPGWVRANVAGFREILKPLLEKKYGADYRDTMAAANNLAAAYWSAKQLDRSIPLFEEVLKRKIDKLGRDNPDSIAACDEHGLAMLFTGVRHFRH